MSRPRKSYLRRVHEARKRLERDERRARGEKTEQDKFAADLVERVRRKRA